MQDSRDVCQIDAGLIITRIGEPDLDLTLSCNNFFIFPPHRRTNGSRYFLSLFRECSLREV